MCLVIQSHVPRNTKYYAALRRTALVVLLVSAAGSAASATIRSQPWHRLVAWCGHQLRCAVPAIFYPLAHDVRSLALIEFKQAAIFDNIAAVNFFHRQGHELPAESGMHVIAAERVLRFSTTLMNINKEHAKASRAAFRWLIKLLRDSDLVLELRTNDDAHLFLSGTDSDERLLTIYQDVVVGERQPDHSYIWEFDANSLSARMLLVVSMSHYGSNKSASEILQRVRQRAKRVLDGIMQVTRDLNDIQLDTRLLGFHFDELSRSLRVVIDPFIPSLGNATSLGLIVTAEFYEYAARVAALLGDEEGVRRNLQRIIDLRVDDDIVQLDVQVQKNFSLRLAQNSIADITDLYLQKAALFR